GHETTGNALTWAWHLLSNSPNVVERLHAEVDAVNISGMKNMEEVHELDYAGMVFAEALRTYPPAWVMMRQARMASELGGYQIKKGSLILLSQYITHNSPRYFPDPERFDPDRWTSERKTGLPRFAYFPFGGGPRTCIGEPLAKLEGVLLLARIAHDWSLESIPGSRVSLLPHITLRPAGSLQMRLRRRT
ncbi:MAG TPA: cytochrome P450, partial [Nitrososphaerales archaeon]|nr:cytochrome P450 [Nitrososphaerales archaeon]